MKQNNKKAKLLLDKWLSALHFYLVHYFLPPTFLLCKGNMFKLTLSCFSNFFFNLQSQPVSSLVVSFSSLLFMLLFCFFWFALSSSKFSLWRAYVAQLFSAYLNKSSRIRPNKKHSHFDVTRQRSGFIAQ